MRTDPFPAWPTHSKPQLNDLELIAETPHHTLSLQHFTLNSLDEFGQEGKETQHDYDVIKPRLNAPAPLAGNDDWERVLSDPVELEGLAYKKVVRVHYRHKQSGVVESREVVVWQPKKFPGGVICRPNGGEKPTRFQSGMMEHTSSGLAESPLVAALRELKEEGGVENNEKVTITLLDRWRKDGLIPGMGQDRHFFRVAIHGLEKGFVPEPEPEDDERIVVKVVPIDGKLKHHFSRYTEENGYIVGPEFQEELDWIAAKANASDKA